MTTDIGERGQCRACNQVVLWAITSKGNRMPVDPGEVEGNANLVLERDLTGTLRVNVVKAGDGKHVAHFATCEKRRKS